MTATAPTAHGEALAVGRALVDAVGRVVRGKQAEVELAVTAFLAGGHVLVEDEPGTGKTLLAKALAAAIGGSFGRVQGTPDLLPTDLTGTSVLHDDVWEFRPGPVFANVVLVDELNRVAPRTQSALLEPMEERTVTVDGVTRPLPDPFFLVATQNPSHQVGTFPLPDSQVDRFAVILAPGPADRAAERDVLAGRGGAAMLDTLAPVTDVATVRDEIARAADLHCSEAVLEYVLDVSDATRRDPSIAAGSTTRAAVGLARLARAHAVIEGRAHVSPADVQAVAVGALAHRVRPVAGGVEAGAAYVRQVIAAVPVPTA